MDKEDQRRYLVVGSVILEVVTPLFQQRIVNDYRTGGFGSLQAFINSQNVIHTLFHLRHRNSWCCKDKAKCRNHTSLPLVYCQWKKMYSENPGPGIHNCHCKFTANSVQLKDLDISLSSLILLNCCNLSQPEEESVQLLRQYKNDYLSHNTTGCITQTEYNTLWPDLLTYVLRLDPTKQDDLVRIENRPLDESLCKKYFTFLLDLHQQIEEIKSTMQREHSAIQAVSSSLSSVQTTVQGMDTEVQRMNTTVLTLGTTVQGMDTSVQGMDTTVQGMGTTVQGMDTTVQGMDTKVQGMGNCIQGIETSVQQTNELLKELLQKGLTCECGRQIIIPLYNDQPRKHRKQYQLGTNIFFLHQQLNLKSLFSIGERGWITDAKMMDDGRLVFCGNCEKRLMICNTDGSQTDSISVQGTPWSVTAVNNSIVAVTFRLQYRNYIEMYDINNKHKLKSISFPGIIITMGIAMINNKLVVGGRGKLLSVDYQTGEISTITTIEGGRYPYVLHASGDRIFFTHRALLRDKTLSSYNYIDNKIYNTKLPSHSTSITSLQDGSLYVGCDDGLIHHVSKDLKHRDKVRVTNNEWLKGNSFISYNTKQKKMVVLNNKENILSIFHEYQ